MRKEEFWGSLAKIQNAKLKIKNFGTLCVDYKASLCLKYNESLTLLRTEGLEEGGPP